MSCLFLVGQLRGTSPAFVREERTGVLKAVPEEDGGWYVTICLVGESKGRDKAGQDSISFMYYYYYSNVDFLFSRAVLHLVIYISSTETVHSTARKV